mmetsp:Transcript_7356/g.21391  ORF Transcript_7356/g.21391 Transcript_7356/m.21391 type:complete len:246 (-) Transcript_7356:421-1158(-)
MLFRSGCFQRRRGLHHGPQVRHRRAVPAGVQSAEETLCRDLWRRSPRAGPGSVRGVVSVGCPLDDALGFHPLPASLERQDPRSLVPVAAGAGGGMVMVIDWRSDRIGSSRTHTHTHTRSGMLCHGLLCTVSPDLHGEARVARTMQRYVCFGTPHHTGMEMSRRFHGRADIYTCMHACIYTLQSCGGSSVPWKKEWTIKRALVVWFNWSLVLVLYHCSRRATGMRADTIGYVPTYGSPAIDRSIDR